ncbi:AAA family ATPase [Burkholderia pyrrocinia]
MSLQIPRPIDPALHPLATGNYRIATPAIEAFYELVTKCLRYRIMGALIYGPPRIGKTRAIEYLRLLLARDLPKITSYHAQCEHKPWHAEGPFFVNLLEAVGDHNPNAGINSAKRMRLTLRIREAAARAGSGTVLLFCDEAQRYNENEYEWLRDVHDAAFTTRSTASRSSSSRSSSASRSYSPRRPPCRSPAKRRSSRA